VECVEEDLYEHSWEDKGCEPIPSKCASEATSDVDADSEVKDHVGSWAWEDHKPLAKLDLVRSVLPGRLLDAVAKYAAWFRQVSLHNVRALGLAISHLQPIVKELGEASDEARCWTCPPCCNAVWRGLLEDYLCRPGRMLQELQHWYEEAISQTVDVEVQRQSFEHDMEHGYDELESTVGLIVQMLGTLQYVLEREQAQQNASAASSAPPGPCKDNPVEVQRRADIQAMDSNDLQQLLEKRLAGSRTARGAVCNEGFIVDSDRKSS